LLQKIRSPWRHAAEEDSGRRTGTSAVPGAYDNCVSVTTALLIFPATRQISVEGSVATLLWYMELPRTSELWLSEENAES